MQNHLLVTLRFGAPIAADSWTGYFNASDYGSECPQVDILFGKPYKGRENCLFLNVYTPQLRKDDDTSTYAVMIFIHGGGFFFGSGNLYGPDFLLDQDIVLVTFNYRLDALGFMSTGDEVVPGNNGMKDQALAIKWVHDNIEAFGGDPKRITLFGESAGGASAQYHMLSPLSQGHFSAAISQSGTIFNVWAFMDKSMVVGNTRRLADHVGCATYDNVKMVECLRSVDAKKLMEVRFSFMKWDLDPWMLFAPIVEPNIKGAFLPDHPLNILKEAKHAPVPWIAGVNSEEGILRVALIYKKENLVKELDENFSEIMSITFNDQSKIQESSKLIRDFYFGNHKINNNTMFNLINMYSNMLFNYGIHVAVKMHFKYSKQPVYYYLYSHVGQHSLANIYGDPQLRYGVSHSDELLLQFPYSYGVQFRNAVLDRRDLHYSELLNKMWTSFAKTGNPTPATDSFVSTKWEPVTTESLEYYNIGAGVHSSKNLYSARMKFWDKMNQMRKIILRDEL
uniref:Carboxylic ester hydrolase n=2 Tax=Photinus pyralis TaxID=7054 RepID=A0A1Y1LVW2_PHOPY